MVFEDRKGGDKIKLETESEDGKILWSIRAFEVNDLLDASAGSAACKS